MCHQDSCRRRFAGLESGLCLLQARKNLELVRGTKDVDKEFNDLVEAARLANMCQHQWARLFSKKYFPQLVLSACSTTFQQWTGINSEQGRCVRETGCDCSSIALSRSQAWALAVRHSAACEPGQHALSSVVFCLFQQPFAWPVLLNRLLLPLQLSSSMVSNLGDPSRESCCQAKCFALLHSNCC